MAVDKAYAVALEVLLPMAIPRATNGTLLPQRSPKAAAHCQAARWTSWTTAAVTPTSTSAGAAMSSAASTRATVICAPWTGVSSRKRCQPLSRSRATRGAVADSAPHMAPKTAIATMISTWAGSVPGVRWRFEKIPAKSK
jgi:hypothetical protein